MTISKCSIIGLLLFCNALFLSAQVDSKYLAGAVPLVDGKVVFTREVKVNASVSNDQLYDLAKEWIYKEFPEVTESKQRVLLADKAESYVVAQGDEKLVFKSMMLMLDQANITYQLIVRTEKGKCMMEVRNIRYEYQDYDRPMSAEDMIIDKVALHKSGEKLNRHYDKFRTFTIDRVDGLRESLIAYLGQVSLENVKAKEVKAASIVDYDEESTPNVAVNEAPMVAVADMERYKQMNASQLAGSISKMFKDSRAIVTFGKGDDAKVMTAAWSGIGNFGGKPVAMTFVNVEGNASADQVYTISFYTDIHGDALDKMEEKKVSERSKTEGLTSIQTNSGANTFAEAWMVIECKKMTEQDSSVSALEENAQSKKWKENKNPKLFMGEIVNVWAR